MIHKSRALIFGHRKLKLNPIDNACSNGSQFKYYISILGGRGVQNLVKHAYIIHEWSLKTISLKFSLEHFKQFASLPHLMFYPWFFISDYYRSLSIAIALKYYYQYHYHYRSKSHYRTSLVAGWLRKAGNKAKLSQLGLSCAKLSLAPASALLSKLS